MGNVVSFNEIRPFVRYVQHLTVNDSIRFINNRAYDNRLFYITDGSGIIRAGDTVYSVKSGVLMLWRAGVSYDITCDAGENCTMFGVNFDFTQANSFKTAPVPPGKDEQFDDYNILDTSQLDMDMFNSTIYLENMQHIEHTLISMKKEYDRQIILSSGRLSAMFLLILTDVARSFLLKGSKIGFDSRIEEILQFINEHYNENLSNQQLGKLFNFHPNYLSRLILAHTGLPLHKYLLNYRINRAIDLLQTSDMPVSEIAEMVGFKDYNHFLKYFKKITGYTTRNFRA
ncbi:MAG TPA: helix-turn-helix transcriptional regulator [Clostridiales bacterium]|nr:helix-turn-helix transcriptional regulator [Clostridiales bacterium]